MSESSNHSPTATAWPKTGMVITGALLTMVLASLDQNIVNTALPRIVGDLGGMEHISWVITAFMLTSTATTTLYGKMSDAYGRRTLIFMAIGVFLAGSLACGWAQTMVQLIVFRAIQGAGAGGLLVLAQAVIGDVIPPADRPRYQGLFTGAFALSSVAGPVVGGAITQVFSWRWVFYLNLPIGALAMAAIAVALPKQPRRDGKAIDWAGAGLLTAGTTTLLLLLAWGGSVISWFSPASAGLVGGTILLLVLFFREEAHAADPMIRLGLFRNVIYARGVAIGGMMVFAMMGSTVYLPLYFQLVLGMLPATAGLMLLPQVFGMVLTSVVGGRIVAKLGRNRPFMLAGVGLELVALASLAAFAWMGARPEAFLASMATLGFGMGMAMPNVTVAVQNAVPYRELGAAMGAMTFVRSLGGAIGVATSGAIMARYLDGAFSHIGGIDIADLVQHGVQALVRYTPQQQALVSDVYRGSLTGCFLLSTVVMAAALALTWGLPEKRLSRSVRH